MATKCLVIIISFIYITSIDCAKILAYFPTPSISHQVVFRPITRALADRGHEVIVITTDPENNVSPNLTQIDVHDVSYKHWEELYENHKGDKHDVLRQIRLLMKKLTTVVKAQMEIPAVKEVFKTKGKNYFDLILIEGLNRPLLALGHIFDAPIIQIYSSGVIEPVFNLFGAVVHPFLYPTVLRQRLYNLTFIEKSIELVKILILQHIIFENLQFERNEMAKMFGNNIPSPKELKQMIKMVFINEHPIWASNRPLPPNLLYIGGIHEGAHKELPKDLEQYLDSSKHGVIYVSFGSNVIPSLLPKEKIEIMSRVFSQLHYDILWKWDKDYLPGKSNNTKISKWFPQSILLHHHKIKLFITQAGLQSTDETINAAVPVIGIPMLGDQWYNSEKYVHHGIGLQLDITTLTEEKLKHAVTNVINDKRYKENILRLRSLMREFPIKPVDNAVWWIEHVIKYGGDHLRNPAEGLSWAEYYELNFIIFILSVLFVLLFILVLIFKYSFKFVYNIFLKSTKLKTI